MRTKKAVIKPRTITLILTFGSLTSSHNITITELTKMLLEGGLEFSEPHNYNLNLTSKSKTELSRVIEKLASGGYK